MPRKTKLKTVTILNVPDFKDDDGLWFKSCSTVHDGVIYQYRTRAWCLWSGVKNRTEDAAHIHEKRPTYLGSRNLFDDFQFLAEWCQAQYGYLNKTNGRFWSIDKDMRVPGTNRYSPETCMFVPTWLNSVVTDRESLRGKYPIGVHWNTTKNRYISQLNNGEGYITVGRFTTPEEAHKAWQLAKSEYLWKLCDENPVLQEHHVARKALQEISDRIYSEWLFEKETKSVLTS